MTQYVERFVFLNPPGILEIFVISLLLLIVFYGALRDIWRLVSLKKKLLLVSLRSFAFILIVLITLNPAVRTETYEETKPLLAVLVDGSWSMNLAGDKDGTSRIQAVRDFFQNHNDFFSEIEKNFLTSYYIFDESLRQTSSDSIVTFEPEGKGTDIGKAIRELESKYDAGELDSVILFSDGADHGSVFRDEVSEPFNSESSSGLGADGSEQARSDDDLLNGIEFPINTVASALEDEVRDVWIDSLEASEVAFLRYPVSVDVEIRSAGFQDLTVPITLKEGDSVVSIQEVSISPEGNGKADFVIRPKSVGRKVYTVSVPVISGEGIRENNEKIFMIDVIIDKIRILHIAGNPSWDVRFLRKTLKANPNVDLVSFFILRDTADSVFASQNELSLIPFPVDEIFDSELETFDLVIFHNFYSRPYGIYEYHLRNLRDYVAQGGGAFFMIGGMNSFDSGSYGRTPISDILPVEFDPIPRMVDETFGEESFRAELTPTGIRHPVMRVVPSSADNRKYWSEMPELDGFNRVEGLKPDTLPLLVTPDGEPILILNKVESGKTASLLSDSSWKWSFARGGEGDVAPYYEEFWNRLIRWSVNDPDLKDVRVKTERASYSLGEEIEMSARALDYGNPEESEEGVKSTLTLPNGTQRELQFEREDTENFASRLKAEEYGIYRVEVSKGRKDGGLDISGGEYGDETVFLVEPPQEEIRGPNINQSFLKAVAEKTGGKAITFEDSPDKLGIDFSPKRKITGYETEKIWDNPWFFTIVVALLSSEWMLRRRWGLK